MRVLFVYPAQENFTVKPVGISLLTAILKREGHEVALFDTSFMDLGGVNYNEQLTGNGIFKPVNWGCDVSKRDVDIEEEVDRAVSEFRPDIIAMSVLDDECALAKKLIGYFRDRSGARIVVGNGGAYKLMKMVADEGISFFIGDAVGLINDILLSAKNERVMHAPKGYFKNLDSLPYLDWGNFDDRHFLKAFDGRVYRGGDHMIGWGCTNSCAYCHNEHWRELHGGMRGCIRMYSPERITDELRDLTARWSLDFWKFHDEDILLKSVKYLELLSQEYAGKVGLPFTCMTNAKSVTERKVELLKGMGCVSVSIGVETGDPVLRAVLNRKETPRDIVNAVRLLTAYDIRVSAFNMIGLPFETEETVKATIRLNRQAGIRNPNVSIFVPLEGTRLYDISVRYGFYKEGQELSTGKPTLRLPGISEERLLGYFKNFYRLVTE